MSIEKTAQPDETGHSLNQATNQPEIPANHANAPDGTVDEQGLTAASKTGKRKRSRKPRRNGTAQPSGANEETEPQRGVGIARSPEPDARDDEKVERLQAPDWRSEQPLPSARNAVDPRGENTPEELYK